MKFFLRFRHFFLLIFIFSFTICLGQKHSQFYNRKGQLIADTNFKINKKQLTRFIGFEDTLIHQILDSANPYRFPEIEREMGMEDNAFIIRFKIHNDSIIYDSVMLSKAQYEYSFRGGFAAEIKSKQLVIKRRAKYIADTNKYYLAFDWKILGEKDNLMQVGVSVKNGKIRITAKALKIINPHTIPGRTICNDASLYTKCDSASVLLKSDRNKVKVEWEVSPKERTGKYLISGIVLNRKTRKGIKNVNIHIYSYDNLQRNKPDSNWEIHSDSNGCFLFENSAKLFLSMTLDAPNYKCLWVKDIIIDRLNGRKTLKINLEPE